MTDTRISQSTDQIHSQLVTSRRKPPVKTTLTDTKILLYVVPLIILIAATATPFGCYFLHICTLHQAIIYSAIIGMVVLVIKALHSYACKQEKKRLNETEYKPLFKKLLKGVIEVTDIETKDLLECIEAAADCGKEFLDDIRPSLSFLDTTIEQTFAFPRYDSRFEETQESSALRIRGSQLKNGQIGFINGILNTESDALAKSFLVSHLSGGYSVDLVHNATHGLVTDLKECLAGSNGVSSPPCELLLKVWNRFFDDQKRRGKEGFFLQICHSQGAILVRNALESYPEERRKRIKVIAIAPAAYIPQELCHNESVHYTSWDPVPLIDRTGMKKAAQVTHLPSTDVDNHSFISKVYRPKLKEKLTAYVKACGKQS